MNYTELIVFVIYFAFMLGIGLFFFFRSKDGGEKDYFLGGRNMGAWARKAAKPILFPTGGFLSICCEQTE